MPRGEAGVALPMALIVLVVLAALAGAVLAVGSSETGIAANHLRTAQALALAEAGLEAAFTAINTSPPLIWNAPGSFQALAVTAPSSGSTLAAYGSYSVQYRSIGLNTVEVASTGLTAAGSGRRVLRAIMTGNLNSVTAVLSKDDITVSGNATVNGACGSIHANDDVSLTGTAVLVAQNATASDAYSVSGSPTIGGVSGGDRPQKLVPAIVPSTFLSQAIAAAATDPDLAVYELGADGTVHITGPGSSTRTLLTTVASSGTYLGWTYRAALGANPPSWAATGSPPGSTAPDKAVFHVQGDAEIDTNVGTPATPWRATVIAARHGTPLRGGNVSVKANRSPYLTAALHDMVLVAGADIDLSGNPTISNGILAARGTVDISGTVSVTGAIISEGETKLRGNVTVNYDCGLNSGITTGLSIIAWGY
jgi:hypothetical protein